MRLVSQKDHLQNQVLQDPSNIASNELRRQRPPFWCYVEGASASFQAWMNNLSERSGPGMSESGFTLRWNPAVFASNPRLLLVPIAIGVAVLGVFTIFFDVTANSVFSAPITLYYVVNNIRHVAEFVLYLTILVVAVRLMYQSDALSETEVDDID